SLSPDLSSVDAGGPGSVSEAGKLTTKREKPDSCHEEVERPARRGFRCRRRAGLGFARVRGLAPAFGEKDAAHPESLFGAAGLAAEEPAFHRGVAGGGLRLPGRDPQHGVALPPLGEEPLRARAGLGGSRRSL